MFKLMQKNQDSLPEDYMAVREHALTAYFKFKEAGRRDFAEQVCRKLLAVEERDWEVRECLVQELFLQGKQEDALEVFDWVAHEVPIEPYFDAIYRKSLKVVNTSPQPFVRRWRFAKLLEVLQATDGVPGDTVELGCYRGLSSYLICSKRRAMEPGFDGHGHHIIDSFQGLSQPGQEDEPPAGFPDATRIRKMTKIGQFSASLDKVRQNLVDFPGIHYWPGWVPQVLSQVAVTQCRFVHVDLDLYEPTLAAISHFWPKLAAGGYLVCDDYNWPGGSRAVNEFCAQQGIVPLLTEYGQAVLPSPAGEQTTQIKGSILNV